MLHQAVKKILDDDDFEGSYIEHFEATLLACVESKDEQGLKYAVALAECDYGGSIWKWNYKESAAIVATFWGEEGFVSLANAALTARPVGTQSVILRTLVLAASASLEQKAVTLFRSLPKLAKEFELHKDKLRQQDFVEAARRQLLSFATNIEPENPVPNILVHVLNTTATRAAFASSKSADTTLAPERAYDPFNVMFHALSTRWFRLNNKILDDYKELIKISGISEGAVHKFIERHPLMLDPFYFQSWSQVPLGESLKADFLVRLMDDEYIIVEIEKPWDPIMNKSNDLSHQATHAIRQALEYREWIVSNHLYAKERFENIWRPKCLVVIGLEGSLSQAQSERLKQENESRQGMVRIVGFDWLLHRADSILNNILNSTLDR